MYYNGNFNASYDFGDLGDFGRSWRRAITRTITAPVKIVQKVSAAPLKAVAKVVKPLQPLVNVQKKVDTAVLKAATNVAKVPVNLAAKIIKVAAVPPVTKALIESKKKKEAAKQATISTAATEASIQPSGRMATVYDNAGNAGQIDMAYLKNGQYNYEGTVWSTEPPVNNIPPIEADPSQMTPQFVEPQETPMDFPSTYTPYVEDYPVSENQGETWREDMTDNSGTDWMETSNTSWTNNQDTSWMQQDWPNMEEEDQYNMLYDNSMFGFGAYPVQKGPISLRKFKNNSRPRNIFAVPNKWGNRLSGLGYYGEDPTSVAPKGDIIDSISKFAEKITPAVHGGRKLVQSIKGKKESTNVMPPPPKDEPSTETPWMLYGIGALALGGAIIIAMKKKRR